MLAAASRIGRPDVGELSVGEMERIATDPRFEGLNVTDVSGADEMGGISGHGYWYANEWIANDVLVLLRFPGITPEHRCLVPAGQAKTLWKFSDDYPDRIAKRMLEFYPEVRRTSAPQVAGSPGGGSPWRADSPRAAAAPALHGRSTFRAFDAR